jgi:hypothetical protein
MPGSRRAALESRFQALIAATTSREVRQFLLAQLQLGFAAVDVPELRRGIERLALALEGAVGRARRG